LLTMQDPTDRLETGYRAHLETAPLIAAESCIPSYVSMVRDHCETDDGSSNKRRNVWRAGMGKDEGSGYETPHSTTTLNASRSSSASPSTMGKTDAESGPCRRTLRHALISKVSLKLQNSGSVARDHLASERTFLAYVRTSLGIVTAGVGA
jgi:putative lipase involved disintegration of autophagic bodies